MTLPAPASQTAGSQRPRKGGGRPGLRLAFAGAFLLGLWFASGGWAWILGAGLRVLGAEAARVRSRGMLEARLEGLRWAGPGGRVRAERLDLPTPLGWALWRAGFRGGLGCPALVVGKGIEIRLEPSGKGGGTRPAPRPAEWAAAAEEWLDRLRSLLPPARLTDVRAAWSGRRLRLAAAVWRGGRLRAAGRWPEGGVPAAVELCRASGATRLRARAALPGLRIEAEAALSARGWRLLAWERSPARRARLEAEGGPESFCPERGELRARGLEFPSAFLPLKLPLRRARLVSFRGEWSGRSGTFHAKAAVESAVSPLEGTAFLEALGRASLTNVSLESAVLRLPREAGEVVLAAPWRTSLRGVDRLAPFSARFALDLGKLGFRGLSKAVSGRARGRIRIAPPGAGGLWAAAVEAHGEGLRAFRLAPMEAQLAAALEGGRLTLRSLEAKGSNFAARAAGVVDLGAGRIERLSGECSGAGAALPLPIGLDRFSATFEGEGPLAEPNLRGEAVLEGVRVGKAAPLRIRAAWESRGFRDGQARIEAENLRARLWAEAAFRKTGAEECECRLQSLVVEESGAAGIPPALRLEAPARFLLRLPGASKQGVSPALAFSPVRLSGSAGAIELEGELRFPGPGRLRLLANNARADRLGALAGLAGARLGARVKRLALAAEWSDGPLTGRAEGALRWPGLAAGEPSELAFSLAATNGMLRLEKLRWTGAAGAALTASARLPVSVSLAGGAPRLRVRKESPLALDLRIPADSFLWPYLGRRFGLRIEGAEAALRVSGTPREPACEATARARRAARLAGAPDGKPWPPLENLAVELSWRAGKARLRVRRAELAGQRAEAEASVPLRPEDLVGLGKELGGRLLRRARLRVRLDEWRLAAFAPWLGKSLGWEGTVSADAGFDPGLRPAGRLQIRGAGLNLPEGLATLREGAAVIVGEPKAIVLTNLSFLWNGRPVKARGLWRLEPGVSPRFEAQLVGSDLTLLRRPDLFLRGSVKARLVGDSPTDAALSGEATLTNSLALKDLESLLAPGVSGPSARPPFFRISTFPFRRWKLDAAIRGERFLRISSPLFAGVASANLQLSGTLGEPILTGDLTAASGAVIFPFGRLAVDLARVAFTEQDPERPKLSLHASGLNYSYAVQLDVSGPADAPQVIFSSVPPLSPAEILAMLTAGKIPGHAFAYTSQSRLQQFGLFLGKQFLSGLAGDPGESRLSIRTGEEVSERGRLTYSIEYRLSPKWSVFGMQNRFDDLLGGFKWRIYAK